MRPSWPDRLREQIFTAHPWHTSQRSPIDGPSRLIGMMRIRDSLLFFASNFRRVTPRYKTKSKAPLTCRSSIDILVLSVETRFQLGTTKQPTTIGIQA